MSRNPTILAAFALVLAGGSACRAQDAATVVGEAVCGPRCVEFVLAWYGRPVEASDLVWELQGGQPDRMVSAAALDEALRRRGVHTRVVRVDGWDAPTWPHPAVLHLRQPNGAGHFVVWVPPKDGRAAALWDGREGFTAGLTSTQVTGLSGVVVLTSPDPIPETPTIEVGTETPRWPLWLAGGLVLGLAAVLIARRVSGGRRVRDVSNRGGGP